MLWLFAVCHWPEPVESRSAFGGYAAEIALIADQHRQTIQPPPAARLWLEENEEQLNLKHYRYFITI